LVASQRKCFGTPLQQGELEGIKAVVREEDPAGVTPAGITESGFLALHMMFIQRGRLETTWTVLRKFGYGEDLALLDNFLYPKWVMLPESGPDQCLYNIKRFIV
jgi:Ras family protein T1